MGTRAALPERGAGGWQGILVELPLAGFFLKKLLRRGCDVNDLPTLDPELYRHLMLLREMSDPEQVDALALTFTVGASELDERREVGPGPSALNPQHDRTPRGAPNIWGIPWVQCPLSNGRL